MRKLNKLVSFLLALVLVMGIIPVGAHATSDTYSDVPDSRADAIAIKTLVRNGVVTGYEDGTFRPDQAITRLEALKVFIAITGAPDGNNWYVSKGFCTPDGILTKDYIDVVGDDIVPDYYAHKGDKLPEYAGAVRWLIVYSCGGFSEAGGDYDLPWPRKDAFEAVFWLKAYMLANGEWGNLEQLGETGHPLLKLTRYWWNELSPDHGTDDYATALNKTGYLQPDAGGSYREDEPITRGELCKLLYDMGIDSRKSAFPSCENDAYYNYAKARRAAGESHADIWADYLNRDYMTGDTADRRNSWWKHLDIDPTAFDEDAVWRYTAAGWAKPTVEKAIKAGIVHDFAGWNNNNYTCEITRYNMAKLLAKFISGTTGKTVYEFADEVLGTNYDIKIAGPIRYPDAPLIADWPAIAGNSSGGLGAFTGDPDYAVVQCLNKLGIITGVGKDADGNMLFAPDSTLTRAQLAAIIQRTAKLLGMSDPGVDNPFVDVKNNWVKPGADFVAGHGLMQGVGGNRFAPDKTLTFQETIVTMYRLYEKLGN